MADNYWTSGNASFAVLAQAGMEALAAGPFEVGSLQDHHKRLTGKAT